MKILITNDDGIGASQLLPLIKWCARLGDVTTVVPKYEQSGKSHGIEIHKSFSLEQVDLVDGVESYALDSTPADCVRYAILGRKDQYDLVISGINRGMNQGGACIYSGTVGAAMEAAMQGVQALAVSLCVGPAHGEDHSDYEPAARLALRVTDWMRGHPLPIGAMYNLNVPPIPYGQIRGIRPATLAPLFLGPSDFDVLEDGGERRYRLRPTSLHTFDDPDCDICGTDRGYATLTRLTWDFRLNADDSELGEIDL